MHFLSHPLCLVDNDQHMLHMLFPGSDYRLGRRRAGHHQPQATWQQAQDMISFVPPIGLACKDEVMFLSMLSLSKRGWQIRCSYQASNSCGTWTLHDPALAGAPSSGDADGRAITRDMKLIADSSNAAMASAKRPCRSCSLTDSAITRQYIVYYHL